MVIYYYKFILLLNCLGSSEDGYIACSLHCLPESVHCMPAGTVCVLTVYKVLNDFAMFLEECTGIITVYSTDIKYCIFGDILEIFPAH